jgi:hypothetical protein
MSAARIESDDEDDVFGPGCGNPYPVTDPLHAEYKRQQRTAVIERIGVDSARLMRLKDLDREQMTQKTLEAFNRISSSRERSPSPRLALPAPPRPDKQERILVSKSLVKLPTERRVVSLVALHGGSTLWIAERDGFIGVVHGFSGKEICRIDSAEQMLNECEGLLDESVEERRCHWQSTAGHGVYIDAKMNRYREAQLMKSRGAPKQRSGITAMTNAFGQFVFVGLTSGCVQAYDAVRCEAIAQVTLCATPIFILHLSTNDDGCTNLIVGTSLNTVHTVLLKCFAGAAAQFSVVRSLRVQGSVRCANASTDRSTLWMVIGSALWRVDLDDLRAIGEHRLLNTTEANGSITCIEVCDCYIILGLESGVIMLFKEVYGEGFEECFSRKVHEGRVTSIHVDPTAREIWSVSSNGEVYVTSLEAVLGYQCQASLQLAAGLGGCCGADIHCHMDSCELWSIAASGLNRIWRIDFNRSRCNVAEALLLSSAAMDEVETRISTCEENIEKLKSHVARRVRATVELMERHVQLQRMRAAYWHLLRWRVRQKSTSTRESVAEVLADGVSIKLTFTFFIRWVRQCTRQSESRCKALSASAMQHCSATSILESYYSSWFAWWRAKKTKARNTCHFSSLLARTQVWRLRYAYDLWTMKIQSQKLLLRRRVMAGALFSCASFLLIKRFFSQWKDVAVTVRHNKCLRRRIGCLERASHRLLLTRAFQKLRAFLDLRRCLRVLRLVSKALDDREMISLQRSYFAWRDFAIVQRMRKTESVLRESEARFKQLKDKEKEMSPLLTKVRKLQSLRQKIDEMQELKVRLDRENIQWSAQIRNDRADLIASGPPVTANALLSPASRRSILVRCMQRLKGRFLNFCSDHKLITVTVDRSRGNVVKMFHQTFQGIDQAVRRYQIVPTEESEMTATKRARWRLGHDEVSRRARVLRIPLDSLKFLLISIKQLVILFDCMAAAEYALINCVDELVLNVESIVVIGETATVELGEASIAL